jgi:hypothetical protein
LKILLDNGVPEGLRKALRPHLVLAARTLNWQTLSNGALLNAAEREGFDVLLTSDKNMAYQQNLKGRRICVLALSDSRWPNIKLRTGVVMTALETVTAGQFRVIEIEKRA